jgi:hypothetical protein
MHPVIRRSPADGNPPDRVVTTMNFRFFKYVKCFAAEIFFKV